MKDIEISVEGKRLRVNTLKEAGEKLIELRPTMARVKFYLDYDLKIKLERGTCTDTVILKSGEKIGSSPRHTSENNQGVTVSTSQGEDNPYLCLNVLDSYLHPFLDRGLCWVYSGHPAEACLIFRNLDKESSSAEELSRLIKMAEEKATEVIDKVLGGGGEKLTHSYREVIKEIKQALAKFLQDYREDGDNKESWERFKKQLLSVHRKTLAAFFSVKIYDLFAKRINPDIFANIVNIIASAGNVDIFKGSFSCIWYEARWISAVGASIVGGEEAIELILGELRALESTAKKYKVEKHGHWALAYQEILVEALALIRPKDQKERTLITQGLEEVAKIDSLIKACSLARFILDKRELPQKNVSHDASEHKIFLKYVEARTVMYNYTFATKKDNKEILTLRPKT